MNIAGERKPGLGGGTVLDNIEQFLSIEERADGARKFPAKIDVIGRKCGNSAEHQPPAMGIPQNLGDEALIDPKRQDRLNLKLFGCTGEAEMPLPRRRQ